MPASVSLTDLQSAIATRLEAHAVFVGPPAINVITEDQGDLGNLIEINLAKLGLAVVVGTPQITGGNLPEVDVTVVVMVTEQPIINRKKGLIASAADVGISAMEQLWGWQPSAIWSPIDEPKMQIKDTEPIIYEVSFVLKTILRS